MTIHFVPTIDHLSRKPPENAVYNLKNRIGYLYMFEYKPRPNSYTAYIKIGKTDNMMLLTRLRSYPRDNETFGEPIIPVNIFWTQVNQNLARETLLKSLANHHPDIEIYYGDEYLLGKEDSIRSLFLYCSSIEDKKIPSAMRDPKRHLYPIVNNDSFSSKIDEMISYTEENNSFNKDEWIAMWNNIVVKVLFICEYCEKDCTNSQGLVSHLKKCQSEGDDLHCRYCNTLLASRANLTKHMLTCKEHKEQLIQSEKNALIDECNKYRENNELLQSENQALRSQLEELKNRDNHIVSSSQINILLEERKVLKRQIELLEELLQYTRDKLNHK
jgi:hypothetical protein